MTFQNRESEKQTTSSWIVIGNFLLGATGFAYGITRYIAYLFKPIIEQDTTGAASYGWAPFVFIFMALFWLLGGLLGLLAARNVHGKPAAILVCTAVAGYLAFAYSAFVIYSAFART